MPTLLYNVMFVVEISTAMLFANVPSVKNLTQVPGVSVPIVRLPPSTNK